MTDLFFAVDPIWWIGDIHPASWLMALGTGLLVWFGLWYRYRAERVNQIEDREPYRYHPIDPGRENYAELTLFEIRRYLTYSYQPHHSWAHTPDHIAEYSTDKRLIEIMGELDQVEYGGDELTTIQKEQIQRELMAKLS